MNAQELFATVARGLLAQGRPSLFAGSCYYRSNPNDPVGSDKCGAGMLMRDEDYDPDCEGIDVRELINSNRCGMGRFAAVADLVKRLQRAHDGPVPSDHISFEKWRFEWRQAMRGIAREFGLSPAVLDEASGG